MTAFLTECLRFVGGRRNQLDLHARIGLNAAKLKPAVGSVRDE